MIQRKQTLFLLLAAVLGVVTLCLPVASVFDQGLCTACIYNLLWIDPQGVAHYSVWYLFVILLMASSLSLVSIFFYKNRPLQAALCLVNVFLFVAWYIALIVVSKSLSPEALNFQPNFPAVLPGVSLILCIMARRGVMSDEKLVRSMDRLR